MKPYAPKRKRAYVLHDSVTRAVIVVRVMGYAHTARQAAAKARPHIPWGDTSRVAIQKLADDGPLGVVFTA